MEPLRPESNRPADAESSFHSSAAPVLPGNGERPEASVRLDGEHWVRDLALRLWNARALIAEVSLAGLLLASCVAFSLPLRYESTTRLMPPDQQNAMGLALLTSKVDEQLGSLASQALGMKSTGALFIGILRSRTLEDRLITRFDLRRAYGMNLWKDARERLEANTEISEDRKSGILTLTVTDPSPQRVAVIARGYVEELDKLSAELATSAARRERVFIEERLKTVKQDLDAAAKDFSVFASRNAAIDISAQGKALLEAAASVQGQLIAAEAQASSLKQIYTENNVRVRAAEARAQELKRQIRQMEGRDSDLKNTGSGTSTLGSYPPIRRLPVLGVTYADLFRRVKIQETVYETLTKQYELAKIQEAREIPTVRVLDPANVPEKKSGPKRLLLMAFGTFFAGFLAMTYLLASDRWRTLGQDHTIKVLAHEVQQGLARDYEAIRARLPWVKNGARPPE